MERSPIVIDASVVVKWFVEEEFSREARLMRDSYVNRLIDLAAPSLMPYEVLNALKYSGAFGEDELKDLAIALDDYQIELYELKGDIALKAIEIAMRKGVTIYDAAYIALAQHLRSILYTADERLIRKIGGNYVRHTSQFRV
ncbi:MAG: PIN domain nuclease [Thermoprotei archaeon]|nr:MAG: PIN domain nuclease [Thermoprotei archaeon]